MLEHEKPFLRNWQTFFVCIAAASYLVFLFRGSIVIDGARYFTLFDDAMISMRFARNASMGAGFVWNIGEAPVEGFTNPLWTLWMAVLHFVPVPEGWTPFLVGVSSAACLLGTIAGAIRLSKLLDIPVAGQMAVALLTASCYPLVFWSLRGMETGLIALCAIWLAVAALKSAWFARGKDIALFAALCAILVLVRMDTVVIVAATLLWLFVCGPAKHFKVYASAGLTAIFALGGLILWRHSFYGELLPNTYYLKITGVSLAQRLRRGVQTLMHANYIAHFAPSVIPLCFLPLIKQGVERRTLAAFSLVCAIIAFQLFYSIWAGGDAWEWANIANRYVVPCLPLLFVASIFLVHQIAKTIRVDEGSPARKERTLALAMAAGTIWFATNSLSYLNWIRTGGLHVNDDKAATWTALCLRKSLPETARLGILWAGTIPYFTKNPYVDLLGKMDPHIARMKPKGLFHPGHNKWDYKHSIVAGQAEFILQVWGNPEQARENLAILAGNGFREIPRGWDCYQGGFLDRSYVRG